MVTTCTANPQPVPDFAKLALDTTVFLEMEDKDGNSLGTGNGFFVAPNLIVTNPQIIEGSASGTAKLLGHATKFKIEGFTNIDKVNNLILLRVNAPEVKSVSISKSENFTNGAIVYITGNRKGTEGTMSDNIIRIKSDKKTSRWIEIKNPVFPGSSGSPVINDIGEVIGVFFYLIEDKQKGTFIIPSRFLKQLIAQTEEVKSLSILKQSVSPESYFRWGYIKDEMKDYKGAIADLTQAIQLRPAYILAYNARGIARSKSGQYSLAISDYDIVIRMNPDFLIAYNNRGIAKASLGQFEDAIKDYDTVIENNKNFLAAYGNRGRAKEALGKYTSALSDYNTILRFRPDDPIGYYNRGSLHTKMKKFESALSDYNKAIMLKPSYVPAFYRRGILQDKMGRTLDAIHDLQTALKLMGKSDFPELRAKIEKALQQIKSKD